MSRKASHTTKRQAITRFDQIINVGPATTGDFERLGMKTPQDLIGQDPLVLYQNVCRIDDLFHDPCVLDVFMATVDYMNGNPPRQWWDYTSERKRLHSQQVKQLRGKY